MSVPDLPEDFLDLLGCLEGEQCDYVVVGAHALAAHGLARATGDLDVFVRPERENAGRVYRALSRFGAPLAAHQVAEEDFAVPGTVYQMGLPPRRIDVLTAISGVSFDEAVSEPVVGALGSARVRCIGLEAMIRNKRAAGRPKDLADAAALEALRAGSRR